MNASIHLIVLNSNIFPFSPFSFFYSNFPYLITDKASKLKCQILLLLNTSDRPQYVSAKI